MANIREDIVDIELEGRQLHRSFASTSLGEGDIKSQKYGVRMLRNGEPENIDGSVVGYFIRQDGQTVTITGEKDGNVGTVTLEEACYVVPGNFTLAIKITNEDMSSTVRIVDGTIVDTMEGDLVDPGSVIPDLSDYEDYAEAIEAAAETVEGLTLGTTKITGSRYKLTAALPS